MTPAEIAAIRDPAARAKAATGFLERGRAAIDEVVEIRAAAIRELLAAGGSTRTVAAQVGVSATTVATAAKASKRGRATP